MSNITTIGYKTHRIRQDAVQHDVRLERVKQLEKWGPQTHPDGTGPDGTLLGVPFSNIAEWIKNFVDAAAEDGQSTWLGILLEEVFEAAEETDLAKLRVELIQVQAVAQAWVEDIDAHGELRDVCTMRDALQHAIERRAL